MQANTKMKLKKPTIAYEKSIPNTYLTAQFKLILHTKLAYTLLVGNWEYGKLGLIQFANHITDMWNAYKQDDPYAEWYLLKIFNSIHEAKEKLKKHEDNLTQQFNHLRGLEIELYSNPKPFKQPLYFVTPFGFMMAMLLEQVDYVNRQLFTLHRLGLTPEELLLPTDLMRVVQGIFKLARDWRHTGITRKDILENNQQAQKVKRSLGDIPAAVLNKEIQFQFLPNVKQTPKETKS